MQLKLSDISPGDIIEHESWGCNHGGVQERLTRRKGKVIQVTDNVITLQGKNYPETLLVNDLLSGRAKILKVKMRGADTMTRDDYMRSVFPDVFGAPDDGGFTAADEEPIPYTPVENPFDLNRFKIAVLEIFQEVARANQAPAYVSLAFMNAIIDTYPEKGE